MGVMDRYNEKKKKKDTEEEKSTKSGVLDRYEKNQYYQTLDTTGVDENYVNAFISDANTFFKGIGGTESTISFNDARSAVEDLGTRYDTVRAWLYNNRDKLGEKNYASYANTFDSFGSGLDSIKNYYSQWETEDDYNAWYDDYKAKQAILNAEDFDEYSQIGANIKNPTYAEADGGFAIGNWRPFGKADEIGNIVTFSRDNIEDIKKSIALSNNNADIANTLGDYRYQFMDDNEVAIYNYYLGKGEKEKADEFFEIAR